MAGRRRLSALAGSAETQRRLDASARRARRTSAPRSRSACSRRAVVAQATLLAHVIAGAFLGGATLAASRRRCRGWPPSARPRPRRRRLRGRGGYGAARVMAGLRSRLVRHLLLVRRATCRRAGRRAGGDGGAGSRCARGVLRPLPAAGGSRGAGAAADPRLDPPAQLGVRGDPGRDGAADPGLHGPDRLPAERSTAGAGAALDARRPLPRPGRRAWRRCAPTAASGRPPTRSRPPARATGARRWRRCGSASSRPWCWSCWR